MKINDLRTEIPYEWRVQQSKQNGCLCVAYITARQAMDTLDAVCGPEGWQDKYYEVAGKLYCSVGLKIEDPKGFYKGTVDGKEKFEAKTEWVWKSDCGTESNIEKDKGQASDAFKRACVKWGLGRFLYSLDMVWLPTMPGSRDQKYHPIHNVEKLGEIPSKYVLDVKGKPTVFLNERLISEYINEIVIPRRQK